MILTHQNGMMAAVELLLQQEERKKTEMCERQNGCEGKMKEREGEVRF